MRRCWQRSAGTPALCVRAALRGRASSCCPLSPCRVTTCCLLLQAKSAELDGVLAHLRQVETEAELFF